MWKGCVNYFQTSGGTDQHLLPYTFLSLTGDVGKLALTLGEDKTLNELIQSLDETNKVISYLDNMKKGFYSLQQGSHETVTQFGVRFGYALIEMVNTFPEVIPKSEIGDLKRSHFYGGLFKEIRTAINCEMCRTLSHDKNVTYDDVY